MAVRNVLLEGDLTLAKKSRPVTDFNKRLHTLLDDMHETLLEVVGAGLAAVQVGVLRRVIIVLDTNDGAEEEEPEELEEQFIELVNPEIIESEGTHCAPEGCLSIPGMFGFVERPMRVVVRAQDRFGKSFTIERTGFTARALCHEIDHLEGRLFRSLAEGDLLTNDELDELYEKQESERNSEKEKNS